MPNTDLSGRFMDFVQVTADRMAKLEADNVHNKAAIEFNTRKIERNNEGINTTQTKVLELKVWAEKAMGNVVWKTVTYVGIILGLASAAFALFGGGGQ